MDAFLTKLSSVALFQMSKEPIFAALLAFGTPTAALPSAFADQFGEDMGSAECFSQIWVAVKKK